MIHDVPRTVLSPIRLALFAPSWRGWIKRWLPVVLIIGLVACSSNGNPTAPNPIFTMSGSGYFLFDMPPYVTRVHIVGSYAGDCSNFIVHIGGRLVVNQIIGMCTIGIGPQYDGTVLTSGGVVEVIASGPWSFTEVR